MGKPKTVVSEAVEAEPEPSPGFDLFDDFLRSLPGEGQVRVSLKRLPSDMHPTLAMAESLYPAPVIGDFETMQEEVSRRHGPGEYSLIVNWFGGEGRRDRKFKTVRFRIGVTDAGALGAGTLERELVPVEVPGALDNMRAALGRAAQLRTEAIELEGMAKLAGMGAGASAAPLDTTKMLVELIGAVKGLFPAAAPAGADAVGTVSLFKEMFAFFQQAMPEGGPAQSLWAVVIPHLADILKTWGPYLPHVASALAQAKAAVSAGGVAGVVAVPEIPLTVVPSPGATDAAIVQLTGGNGMLAQVVKAFLDMAFIECQKEHTPESAKAAYDLLAGYGDLNFPGMLDYIMGQPASGVFASWGALDARLAGEPKAKAFCEGFYEYLRSETVEEGKKEGA